MRTQYYARLVEGALPPEDSPHHFTLAYGEGDQTYLEEDYETLAEALEGGVTLRRNGHERVWIFCSQGEDEHANLIAGGDTEIVDFRVVGDWDVVAAPPNRRPRPSPLAG